MEGVITRLPAHHREPLGGCQPATDLNIGSIVPCFFILHLSYVCVATN